MPAPHFFDVVLERLNGGNLEGGVELLAGALAAGRTAGQVKPMLWGHALHKVLMEDPLTARGFSKPRGYAGDGVLLDMIYDRRPPPATSQRGHALFAITSASLAAAALRQRLADAEALVEREWTAGKRICALGCGHWREADRLVGRDLSNVVVVDRDPLSLERIWQVHSGRATLFEAGALAYLRRAASESESFDCIYTLSLADRFDERTVAVLMQSMQACLNPGGRIVISTFGWDPRTAGWMDAVMDWRLAYRSEPELHRIAKALGLRPSTWRHALGMISWCEMKDPR